MSFQEYVDLIKAKYSEAEQRLDYAEAIRLMSLLRDVCAEQIEKLEQRRAEVNS